ncbi:transposase [Bradyrhizobium sp. 179]|nr:transposase [Bradyrhizobium sp. 179]
MLEGPITTECFLANVDQILPHAARGPDGDPHNLSSEKNEEAACLIEGAGARLPLLPPYSPDLNSLEMTFATLKELMRQAQTSTDNALGRHSRAVRPRKNSTFLQACA